jgi:tetratricopeptide (TPR) repeat protein
MRAGKFDQALDQWRALCKLAPDKPQFFLFRGVAHHRLEQGDKAEKALRRAVDLDGGKSVVYRLNLVDLLAALKRTREALEEIEAAVPAFQEFEPVMALELRKVDVLCTIGNAVEANEVLDRLFRRMAEKHDAELPKYVSSQIAGTAAKMFSRHRLDDANGLLERCHEIHPDSPVHHPFPERALVDARALPPHAQAWLRQLKPDKMSATLGNATWPWPGAAFIAGVWLLGLAWLLATTPMEAGTFWAALLPTLALAAAALGWSMRTATRILQSPLRSFTTIHPLYLLRAKGTTLEVYPLFNLVDLKATHHHTNGVYTQTAIELRFGQRRVRLSVRGKEHAEAWLRHLVELRARSLELLGEGFLEAEPGIDLLPPALLTDPDAAPLSQWGRAAPASRATEAPVLSKRTRALRHSAAHRRGALRWYGAFAAAAVLVAGVSVWSQAKMSEQEAFGMAMEDGHRDRLASFAARYPGSRFLPEIERVRARRLEGLERVLGGQTSASPPGTEQAPLAAALRDAAKHLATQSDHVVALRVEVDATAAPAAATAFGAALMTARIRSAVGGLLASSIAHARLDDLLDVEPEAAPESAAAVLHIRATVRPHSGELVRVGAGDEATAPLPALTVDWEAKLEVPGQPPSATWRHTSPVPRRVLSSGGSGPDAAYRHLASTEVEVYARELAAALGLESPAIAVLLEPSGGGAQRGGQ